MQSLSHSVPGETVGEAIDRCARALRRSRLWFGHGTDNARDEAAELVFFVARLDHSVGAAAYGKRLTPKRRQRIDALLTQRISQRVPLAYLTRRAFFAGLELFVDARVLVPRSPIAEIVLRNFSPWVHSRRVRRVLDIGTGSGAIALACARAFPHAAVDAVDVSRTALQVCRRNVRRLGLRKRVRVLQSDHFSAVSGRRYDIIVSNPPYVSRAQMARLPREYRHEPRIGLAAGKDGLDSVRVILAGAGRHLTPAGILVVEVGDSDAALIRAFPRLPFIWLDFAHGGGGVFVLTSKALRDAEQENPGGR